MSGSKKSTETPVDKYKKLKSDLKHEQRALNIATRNVSKLEKELSNIEKKLWFCPVCNQPQILPSKKEARILRESREEYNKELDDYETLYYDCKYALCAGCDKYVLIDKIFVSSEEI